MTDLFCKILDGCQLFLQFPDKRGKAPPGQEPGQRIFQPEDDLWQAVTSVRGVPMVCQQFPFEPGEHLS